MNLEALLGAGGGEEQQSSGMKEKLLEQLIEQLMSMPDAQGASAGDEMKLPVAEGEMPAEDEILK